MPESLPKEKRAHKIDIKHIIQQYYQVLKNKNFLRYTLSACFLIAAMCPWQFAAPFLVISKFHYNTFYYGLIQSYVFAFFIIGLIIIKKYMHECNIPHFITAGSIAVACGGICAVTLTYLFPHHLIAMIIAMMLYALGTGLSFSVLSRLAIEVSDMPMGVRMGTFTTLKMSIITMLSIVLAIFYNGTLFSVAIIGFIFMTLGLTAKAFIPRM